MNIEQALKILKPSGDTDEALKNAYRMACKKYHPDINPDGLELMKLINAAYGFLKEHLGKWHTTSYNSDDTGIDEIFQDIFNAIRHFRDIHVEVCGTWLWVNGNTKPYKDQFKDLGFKWAPNKHRWYWRPEGYRKRSKRVLSMAEIRFMYGSNELETEPLQAIG